MFITHKMLRVVGFTNNRSLIVWCPVCRVWHTHGNPNYPPGSQTSRVPHCARSPGSEVYDEYLIEIIGPASREVLADYKRKRPHGLKRQWKQGDDFLTDTIAQRTLDVEAGRGKDRERSQQFAGDLKGDRFF